jgi:hypothetical protein
MASGHRPKVLTGPKIDAQVSEAEEIDFHLHEYADFTQAQVLCGLSNPPQIKEPIAVRNI